jgi:hypothetical protein
VLTSLLPDGTLAIDPGDEIHRSIVVCAEGVVTAAVVRSALKLEPLTSPAPEAVLAS